MHWDTIDTVFFDMDGTLIDLHFEDAFWLKHLPECYAAHHQLPIEEARNKLLTHHRSIMGTLDWYCLDYWDNYLKMDTLALTKPLLPLLQFRPYVTSLLSALQSSSIRTAIITNAHPRSFDLKDKQLNLSQYMDHVISAHTLKHPKEESAFWEKLQTELPFNPERTLFIDDNLAVLNAAKDYGIKHILAIPQPNSKHPPKPMDSFNELHDFRALLPAVKVLHSTARQKELMK